MNRARARTRGRPRAPARTAPTPRPHAHRALAPLHVPMRRGTCTRARPYPAPAGVRRPAFSPHTRPAGAPGRREPPSCESEEYLSRRRGRFAVWRNGDGRLAGQSDGGRLSGRAGPMCLAGGRAGGGWVGGRATESRARALEPAHDAVAGDANLKHRSKPMTRMPAEDFNVPGRGVRIITQLKRNLVYLRKYEKQANSAWNRT